LKKQHRQNPTTLRIKLETLKKLYVANETKSYEECVKLAIDIFQDVFNYQIRQLLSAFPADHIVEDTGKPFWSGLKRVPTPLELDFNDKIHVELIQAGANIYATMFNIPMETNAAKVVEIAKKIPLQPFVPKAGVKIETDEKKKEEEQPVMINDEDEREIEKLLKDLEGYNINQNKKGQTVEFEKDDPSNFHIEFMGGVSNLRVRLCLYRLVTIRSKRLIISRSSSLQERSSLLLLPLLPWSWALLVSKSSNSCSERKLRHTRT
jgi:ubiquitin-activating enzyme E1